MSSKHRLLALLGAGLTALAVSATAMGTASAADMRRIDMHDDCDPVTFAFVPGGCRGDGETTFSQFLREVQTTGAAEDWFYDPSRATVRPGQMIVARNVGGEVHTFTCVKAFGGGVVAALNVGANQTLATPCDFPTVFAAAGPTSVVQGNSASAKAPTSGTAMYQCVIHPWMRTILRVRN